MITTWEALEEPTPENYERAARNASLGVGHVWTNVRCPAYRSLAPADCACGERLIDFNGGY